LWVGFKSTRASFNNFKVIDIIQMMFSDNNAIQLLIIIKEQHFKKTKKQTKPKRQEEWEKIFANDVTYKGVISKIYKQLI